MGIGYDEEDLIFDVMILKDAIRRLSPKYQMILALKSAGYTQEESGTIMGLTKQAIGFGYKRAVKALRVVFKNLSQEEDA